MKLVSARTKIIACAIVIEEMLPILPAAMTHQSLDSGLHINPGALNKALQEAIDSTDSSIDTIILGYGLCSQAVIGLKTGKRTIIIPKVDDCIAIFLGSNAAYRKQSSGEPGTYYLTKSWIEAECGPFSEYDILVEQYGKKKADWLMSKILNNYTRLVYINSGDGENSRFREYSKETAQRFGLRFEEIKGSLSLIEKAVRSPREEEFIIARPGRIISYSDFKT